LDNLTSADIEKHRANCDRIVLYTPFMTNSVCGSVYVIYDLYNENKQIRVSKETKNATNTCSQFVLFYYHALLVPKVWGEKKLCVRTLCSLWYSFQRWL